MKSRTFISALTLILSAGAAFAQEPPWNVTEVSNFDQPGQQYADVWGDGNFAYLAHFGQRVVDIVDISDPQNPMLAATYDSGVFLASAQDVKVADGLMFVGLEGASPGCQIVDVRDPFAPVKLTDVTVLPAVHNVFYDQGWLYLVDSSQPLVEIVDLTDYDPDDPPATISTSRWRLTGVGDFVHDVTVQNGRLYASAWDTIRIYDVSDVANTQPTLMGSAPGSNVHAAWATNNGRFLVVAEEHGVGGLALYEVFDDGETVTLEARDYYFLSSLRAGSVHNPVVLNNRVYVSWYAAGVQVLEIDPVTSTWFLVASFDTTVDDGDDSVFDGCWGVYPFLSTDRVLASDRDTGLWVLDVEPNVLVFRYPNGLPTTVAPNVEAPVELLIKAAGAQPDAATVTRHATVDGGPPDAQVMTQQASNFFVGTLPATACGSVIEVSFSADNLLGTTFVDPPEAPAETYRVDVAIDAVTVFEDDFEADLGWTVENTSLIDGAWERGDPLGTGAQPGFDATGANDGACFFTKQGFASGSIGADDVDGGPTVLTSPPIDLSPGGGVIAYSYWLFNDDETDALIVEVSDDGATWVEARRYAKMLGGWRQDRFHSADFVAPSATTQVRFVIADNPNNSVTEAAVDDFSATVLDCDDPIFADGFESGDTSAWSTTLP